MKKKQYVINLNDPELSELGNIVIEKCKGYIKRIYLLLITNEYQGGKLRL